MPDTCLLRSIALLKRAFVASKAARSGGFPNLIFLSGGQRQPLIQYHQKYRGHKMRVEPDAPPRLGSLQSGARSRRLGCCAATVAATDTAPDAIFIAASGSTASLPRRVGGSEHQRVADVAAVTATDVNHHVGGLLLPPAASIGAGIRGYAGASIVTMPKCRPRRCAGSCRHHGCVSGRPGSRRG
jgi:hypothetical protein